MIVIAHDFSLKDYNTFGISVFAKAYTAATTLRQLQEALSYYSATNVFLLGGGSNMLLTTDIKRPVIHVLLKGITVVKEQEATVFLKVMAGENWHELVLYCVTNNLGGLENMSLIPGNVGTAPIQNIGAYGVELKDVFESCEVMHLKTQEIKTMSLIDCGFGYRESVFKNELRDQYVITSVTFKLTDVSKATSYKLKTDYGDIKAELARIGGSPSIKNVSQAVINIRQSKLPDPAVLGNSGSFFKNPIVAKSVYENLITTYPDMPHYPINDQQVKVPAGWLIDQCGLQGYRIGDAAVHDKQALVLVNHGNATGKQLLDLATYVQQAVLNKYGIAIATEVNIIAAD